MVILQAKEAPIGIVVIGKALHRKVDRVDQDYDYDHYLQDLIV